MCMYVYVCVNVCVFMYVCMYVFDYTGVAVQVKMRHSRSVILVPAMVLSRGNSGHFCKSFASSCAVAESICAIRVAFVTVVGGL
jgi:hypothetical protein